MRYLNCCFAMLAIAGCAGAPADRAAQTIAPSTAPAPTVPESGDSGEIRVTMGNIAGERLAGRLDLNTDSGRTLASIPIADGSGAGTAAEGEYQAYAYAMDDGIPVLVAITNVVVSKAAPASIAVELTEGAGTLSLLNFDQDYDFVLDRLELEQGTDPGDAASYPGAVLVPLPDTVLRSAPNWYGGDLHTHSKYDPYGTESVADLIRRAEVAGLDFLAIADRNSLEACEDPEFKSSQLVLLPAMEWGNDEKGVALIYGPRTRPSMSFTFGDAQAMVVRQQAQGAFVAVAHPCFPTMPWQWGLSYMGGIEVWAREWNGVPPAVLEDLNETTLERKNNELIFTLAKAVATKNLSANGQASLYYDMELVRQLKAAAIAGSLTGSSKVPIGRPVTFIYARNLSAPALLEGLIAGRTFVTTGMNGPKVLLRADVMDDGTIDLPVVGGSVPVGVPVRFEVIVQNARGKKMEILRNGRPERSQWVDEDSYAWSYMRVPDAYSDYRVRIVDSAESGSDQYGHKNVLAMTSPIYAENILPQIVGPNVDPQLFRVRIQSYYDDYNRLQAEGLPSNAREITFPKLNR